MILSCINAHIMHAPATKLMTHNAEEDDDLHPHVHQPLCVICSCEPCTKIHVFDIRKSFL